MFNTEKEMLESADVIKRFDFDVTKNLAREIGTKRVIFTGMGSSVLFPAKQAKSRAFELNISNKVEEFFASDLLSYNDFSETYVLLCSNSGMTKETILLLEHIKKKKAKCVAVTAVPDSILAKRCKQKIIMQCGFEKGVAATKSVIEQGLILDSLVLNLAKNQGKKINFGKIKKYASDASKSILWNINVNVPNNMVNALANASSVYFIGRKTGVADEITLKSHEIARKSAFFYPDTHIVHGIEESIESSPIVLFEPSKFKDFISDFRDFSKRIDAQLFGIDSQKIIEGVKIKSTPYFENYCLLAAGWGLLRNIAKKQNINIDKPKKAVKVGNQYKGK
ncbi:SIS domain-containing protein [Candidatus Woesearchaeota archaeon]|nr:SIS domain-containing protein [Candidatus Woesearchaeota archaeon]